MKSNFTFFGRRTEFAKAISVIFLLLSSFIIYSCNSSAKESVSKKSEVDEQRDDDKVFTFHQNKNGKDNSWKAVFKDGELKELYKNGQKIPDENIEDYQDMVNEEIEGLQDSHRGFGKNSYHFNFDNGNLDNLGENFGDMNFDNSDSLFDSEQFHKNMDSLRNNMKKFHKMKFNFHFDTTAFNKGMRELKENLKHLRINPHVYVYKDGFPGFDMEVFKEGMEKFKEEMKHNRIFDEDFHIDMKNFDHNMDKFKENMKNFDFNMKDFKKNMKKLNAFLKDLRHELVKDNLIKDEDDKFNMKFNSKEMIINGNKVSEDLLQKYKGIYKQHYGKDIDDEFNINNNYDHHELDDN